MKKFILFAFCAAVIAVGSAHAESVVGRTGLGGRLGLQKLVGGAHDYANVDQNFGLWVRRGLSPRWSLAAELNYGWNRPGALRGVDAGLSNGSVHAFYTTMINTSAGVRYHFQTESPLAPYAGARVGLMNWRVRDENGGDFGFFPGGPTVLGLGESGLPAYLEGVNALLGAGLGIEYFVSPQISVDLGLNYTRIIGLDRDNVGTSALWGAGEGDVNEGRWDLYLGGTYYFGGDRDRDHDGIDDDQDGCPDAPEDYDGYRDADGCPDLDNDADGVPDVRDACPNDPEDRDGFQDDDGCPDPDNDGDGLLDAFDGCPDSAEDFDGDQDADGCPDLGDPGVGGTNDNVSPVAAEITDAMVLEGVVFLRNSAELTSSSFAVLDQVVASLLAYPAVTVEIQGHTDSVGEAAYNLNMSRRRAATVRNYLMGRGIAAGRLTAVGYGEAMPVADNSTPEGRAANRRVELLRTN